MKIDATESTHAQELIQLQNISNEQLLTSIEIAKRPAVRIRKNINLKKKSENMLIQKNQKFIAISQKRSIDVT